MTHRNHILILIVSALAAFGPYASAQNGKDISGTVTSDGGQPLPGVVVMSVGGGAPSQR